MYLVFMYVLPFGGLSVLNLLMFLDVRKGFTHFFTHFEMKNVIHHLNLKKGGAGCTVIQNTKFGGIW